MLERLIHKAGREEKGFTLIELLIVVAIIAILAAVAIPNFLNARSRATLSNVKADIKNMSTALETYMADNDVYPPGTIALMEAALEPDYMTAVPVLPNAQGAYRYGACDADRNGAGLVTYALDTNDKAFGPGTAVEVSVMNAGGVVAGASDITTTECTP